MGARALLEPQQPAIGRPRSTCTCVMPDRAAPRAPCAFLLASALFSFQECCPRGAHFGNIMVCPAEFGSFLHCAAGQQVCRDSGGSTPTVGTDSLAAARPLLLNGDFARSGVLISAAHADIPGLDSPL